MLSVLGKNTINIFRVGMALPISFKAASKTQALRHYSPGLVNSTRHSLILQSVLRPRTTSVAITPTAQSPMIRGNITFPQQRSISFWNIPLELMKASPIQRRLALVGLGGASLVVAVILGPFLLVGLGGIAAVMGFRFWRFRNQLIKQANQNDGLNDWSDFLNAFIQQQQGQVFGKDHLKVETEAIKRLERWSQTEQGRNQLIEYGVHPDTITKNVSIRGSSFASMSGGSVTTREIKIELDLRNSPGSVLVATAQLDKEGNMTMSDIKLVTATRHVLHVPLSIQNIKGSNTTSGNGRVIEGEFRDIQ